MIIITAVVPIVVLLYGMPGKCGRIDLKLLSLLFFITLYHSLLERRKSFYLQGFQVYVILYLSLSEIIILYPIILPGVVPAVVLMLYWGII